MARHEHEDKKQPIRNNNCHIGEVRCRSITKRCQFLFAKLPDERFVEPGIKERDEVAVFFEQADFALHRWSDLQNNV